MGRLSQLFWVLQADTMPNKMETKHHYTHLDIETPSRRKEIVRLRREFAKIAKENDQDRRSL